MKKISKNQVENEVIKLFALSLHHNRLGVQWRAALAKTIPRTFDRGGSFLMKKQSMEAKLTTFPFSNIQWQVCLTTQWFSCLCHLSWSSWVIVAEWAVQQTHKESESYLRGISKVCFVFRFDQTLIAYTINEACSISSVRCDLNYFSLV